MPVPDVLDAEVLGIDPALSADVEFDMSIFREAQLVAVGAHFATSFWGRDYFDESFFGAESSVLQGFVPGDGTVAVLAIDPAFSLELLDLFEIGFGSLAAALSSSPLGIAPWYDMTPLDVPFDVGHSISVGLAYEGDIAAVMDVAALDAPLEMELTDLSPALASGADILISH